MNKELEIAITKFQLIAPVLNDAGIRQKEYFLELSKKEHMFPYWGKKKFSRHTFKKWLGIYRREGLEGLICSHRKDKGNSRCISKDIQQTISELINQYQFRTVQNLYDYMLVQKIILPDQFTYVTLNNFLRKNNLFDPNIQKQPRKAFEVEHINQLWLTDFMYGPYVIYEKKKVQVYLCAQIDDFSRLITAAAFYPSQSLLSLEQTLKQAINSYGIPQKIYCDNGKVFLDGHLSVISARLGFVVIHSKVHDAASRGKIERWFRTVRDCFIPKLYIGDGKQPLTLELLNQKFQDWLLNQYNKKIHSSIQMTPFDRYFKDMENVRIRTILKNQLDIAFLHTITRKVNNDATVPFENKLFEVNPKYIGQKIEIRFDPFHKDELFHFENEKQIAKLHKLDKQANSRMPIRFNGQEDKSNV